MSFLQRKISGTQKLFPGIVGLRSEVAAIKYAIKQMDARASQALKLKDYPNVFYFYGPVGSGKSTLLELAYQDCARGELGFHPLAVWFNCEHVARSEAIGPESFMVGLAKAIIEADENLARVFQPLFDRWDQYSKEEAKASNVSFPPAGGPAAPAGPQAQVLRTAAPRQNSVQNAYSAIGSINAKKRSDGSQSIKSIARSVNRNIQAQEAQKRVVPQAPTTNIRGEIMQHFTQAVDALSRQLRVVFFLDNYEAVERQDDWFRQDFLPQFQNELIFVMAGRTDLHKVYQTQLGNVASCVRMKNFNVFDTEMYFLKHLGLRDPKTVIPSQRLADGNPLCVSILSGAIQHVLKKTPKDLMEFLEEPDEDYGDKQNKYLIYIMMDELPKVDQNLLAVLAIMREYDMYLFQNLSGAMNVKRTLDGLSQRYGFVSGFGQMSKFMKHTIRGYVKQELPHLYEEINQAAYEYFAEMVREDPDNHELLYDSLYYYFHVDSHAAYKHYIHVISHFLHTNLDFCDRLCIEILDCSLPKEWKNSLRQIARSLGAYRKKDPAGSQPVLSAISNAEPIEQEELQFLQF